MKQKLLLLFASAMMGLNASAVEWEYPIPAKQAISYGDTVYLYNRDAKAFFVGANYYQTHGSVGPKGYKCVLEKTNDDYVTIKDSVETKGAMYYVFCESNVHECYVDYANNGDINWTFSAQEDGSYIIYTACSTNSGSPLGVTTSEENKTILNFTDPEFAETNWINWWIVSQQEYNNYLVAYDAYSAALSLSEKIEEASGYGLDVTAAQAVYDNTASTLEELTQANDDLQAAINYYKETSVTPDNPKDLTETYIPDADFELNQGAGVWQRTHGAQNYQTSGTANKLGDATTFLEAWHPSAFKGKEYVQITGLPNGVYQFFLSVATNGGNGSYVYAGTDSVEVTSNEMSQYFVFTRVTDGTLEVGYNMPQAIQSWVGIDDAKLLYLGNTAPSYAYWVEKMLEKAPQVDDDTFAQKSLQETYSGMLNADLSKYTTVQDILAFYDQFVETLALFNANLAAYAEFQKHLDAIDQLQTVGYEGDAADDLYDSYESGEISNIRKNMTLSTEEMIAKNTEIADKIDYVKKHCLAPGMECTNLLVNPNFNDRLKGWSHDTSMAEPAWGGLSSNPDVEKWNDNFDFYQVVEGIPNGVYELSVQAFYRPTGDTKGSYDNYISGEKKDEILTFIYANNTEVAVKNIGAVTYSENLDNNCTMVAEGVYCPNGMTSASVAFSKGDYDNTVKGVVVDGVLKVGIKSTTGTTSGRWSLWDNFRLKYIGKDLEAIQTAIAGYEDEVSLYTAEETRMKASLKSAITKSYLDAGEAIDGETAFAALTDLVNALADAKVCNEAYNNLYKRNESFADDILNSRSSNTSLKSEAKQYYRKVDNAISAGSLEIADIDSIIAEIKDLSAKVRVPASDGASEANPIDFTSVILYPSFEDADGNANSEGWVDSGEVNTQNQDNTDFGKVGKVYHERWHENGTIDINQTIAYLPSGFYVLTVGAAHCSTGDGVIYANGNEAAIEVAEPKSPVSASVVGVVGEDGILKIGAKCTLTDKTWFCVDNFSLSYIGTEAPAEIDIPDEVPFITSSVYSISGTLVNGLQKGINLVKMSDGSVKKVIVK